MAIRGIPDISEKLSENLKRLPLILCQDISGSMSDKYELMNKQLNEFFDIQSIEPQVCRRTDLTIIKFNHIVHEPQEYLLSDYKFKRFSEEEMEGTTHLWGALDAALTVSEKYIKNEKYWCPWILLYTDGFSNDETEEEKKRVIKKLQAYEKEHSIVLFILGIGDEEGSLDALNMEELNNISMRKSKVVRYAVNQEIDIYNFFNTMIRTITSTLNGDIFGDNGFKPGSESIDMIYELFQQNSRQRIKL